MTPLRLLTVAAVALLSIACSSTPKTTATAPTATPTGSTAAPAPSTPGARVVKSRDGSYTGEIVGNPAVGSGFAKLQIGMSMDEVQTAMGRAPDRLHTYESGKRWIPFYFGNDARRMQAHYRGEGCLIFTAGGVMGGSGGDLIGITADTAGACYQP